MKKYFLVLLTTIQALVSCGQTKEPSITYKENVVKELVIKNVSVITMKTNVVLKNQDVVIKDGKIVSISDAKKTEYQNMVEIDGTDKYIMPSLADAHVHFPETDAEMEHMMQLYLINGVTKLRSMRGDWNHSDWKNKYNTTVSIYPKLYLSAPPISRNYDLSSDQIEDLVKYAKENGFDFIKILSIKNQDMFTQLDAACKKYNLPLGGHFPSNISDSLIFKSNYTSFEHLGGLAGEPELLENRLQQIKANDAFLCPTLSWYSVGSGRYSYEELRNQSGMEYIPKEIVEDWIEKTKEYREKLGDQAYKDEVANELKDLEGKYQIIKRAHDLGINMLLSPDSSSQYMVSGFSVLGEMELLKNAQLSNYDILKMATANFALFFNDHNYGIIEEGKDADFILLNNNPLDDLSALKDIQGLYYNNQFLDAKKMEAMCLKLLPTSQN